MVGQPPNSMIQKILLHTICVCILLVPGQASSATFNDLSFSTARFQNMDSGKTAQERIPFLITQDFFTPQECRRSEASQGGDILCKQIFSDSTYATAEIHYEWAWEELKIQTILNLFTAKGESSEQRIIRRKIEFKGDKKNKRRQESLDIVQHVPGHPMTREIIILKYAKDGKTIHQVSYAKYDQIADISWASLAYHASLAYDAKGLPLKGKAERWKDGKKVADMFRWHRFSDGTEHFDGQIWSQWESLIKTAAAQEALF